jgi:hypothetical protein
MQPCSPKEKGWSRTQPVSKPCLVGPTEQQQLAWQCTAHAPSPLACYRVMCCRTRLERASCMRSQVSSVESPSSSATDVRAFGKLRPWQAAAAAADPLQSQQTHRMRWCTGGPVPPEHGAWVVRFPPCTSKIHSAHIWRVLQAVRQGRLYTANGTRCPQQAHSTAEPRPSEPRRRGRAAADGVLCLPVHRSRT